MPPTPEPVVSGVRPRGRSRRARRPRGPSASADRRRGRSADHQRGDGPARVGLLFDTGCDHEDPRSPAVGAEGLERARLHRAQVHADERRDTESPGGRLRHRERAHDVDKRRRHQRPQLPYVAAPIQHFEDEPERLLREPLDVRRGKRQRSRLRRGGAWRRPEWGDERCLPRPDACRPPDGAAERPGRGGAGTSPAAGSKRGTRDRNV